MCQLFDYSTLLKFLRHVCRVRTVPLQQGIMSGQICRTKKNILLQIDQYVKTGLTHTFLHQASNSLREYKSLEWHYVFIPNVNFQLQFRRTAFGKKTSPRQRTIWDSPFGSGCDALTRHFYICENNVWETVVSGIVYSGNMHSG